MGHLIYGKNSSGLSGICKIIIHRPSLKWVWNVFSKSKYAHMEDKLQNGSGIAVQFNNIKEVIEQYLTKYQMSGSEKEKKWLGYSCIIS